MKSRHYHPYSGCRGSVLWCSTVTAVSYMHSIWSLPSIHILTVFVVVFHISAFKLLLKSDRQELGEMLLSNTPLSNRRLMALVIRVEEREVMQVGERAQSFQWVFCWPFWPHLNSMLAYSWSMSLLCFFIAMYPSFSILCNLWFCRSVWHLLTASWQN